VVAWSPGEEDLQIMADLVNPVDRREAIVLRKFGGYHQRGPKKRVCEPPVQALLLGTPVQCAQA
jgi:hypothetical protein